MNTREIQDWLLIQIAELLQVDPAALDVREPLANYGLTSRDVVALSGDLGELLGQRLSPTLVYEYPSILALSRHLAERVDARETSSTEPGPSGHMNEPVAIIGMSCRFPGAKDPGAFWQVLREGMDRITEIPPDRWPKQAYYHPDPAVPGKATSKWGGFLEEVDQFDPFFFGISPNEAKQMDPQQRLLLELSLEALDHANQSKDLLDGTRTGVFIGISVNEYSHMQFGDPLSITSHSGTGSALSIAANRISYFFNFRGPSMAIDTACSSSLAAVHLACQSLRNGECPMALAGGVNIILSPVHSIAFTKAGVLSTDGRCKTFDARADGYVRGEGGGVIVLKPLSRALEDGDPVLALISGSAMAQDGRTNGLMAPSQESQEALLREAYRSAGVSPGSVQYVEAHGTGTLLGDSMEAAAIGAVIGAAGTDEPCAIGSVKTNIGHLEAAAGIAGLIKVVLSIKHRTLPPSLHFHTPNPHIPFGALNLQVQNKLKPWPPGPAIAGVSSFGFGGTNVHVVVREAEYFQKTNDGGQALPPESGFFLLPLSANNRENLQSLASGFRDLLAADFDRKTKDICHAANKRRSQYDFRLAAVGASGSQLADGLQAFIAGEQHPNLLCGGMASDRQPKLAFVFSGQGGQWYGMGRELLKQETAFSKTIDRIDRVIQSYFNWSLKDALLAEQSEGRLDEIEVVQPAIFAVQVALGELWRELGITPDAVVGHSMGEVAAAYFAGVLGLEDAVRVVCSRSRLLKKLRGRGGMLATELSPAQAEEVLKGHEKAISIAAINSPTSTVLSGDPEMLQGIMDTLERQNLFCRWVKVDVASHSPQIDLLRSEMLESLGGLHPQPARIPFYSTVTGARGDDLAFDAHYWLDNLRKPVLFSNAIGELLNHGHSIFVEIVPHPILLSPIQQKLTPDQREVRLLPSLRREEPEREVLYRSLGALYTEGCAVAWDKLYPSPSQYVQLPPIPMQRQRYWLDTKPGASKIAYHGIQGGERKVHPLLGERMDLANAPSAYVWQTAFDPAALWYLEDHQINDEIVLPAAAYIEMALQAATESGLNGSHAFSEVVFKQKMTLQKGQLRSVQVQLTPEKEGHFTFRIFSKTTAEEDWVEHVSATFYPLLATEGQVESMETTPDEFLEQGASELSTEEFYAELKERGLHYGPDFTGIEHLWRKENEALGQIKLPESLQYGMDDYFVHPALLDACLQVLAAIPDASSPQDLFIPSACKRIRFFSRPAGLVWSHVSLQSEPAPSEESVVANVWLFNQKDQVLAELTGLRLQRVGRRKRLPPARQNTWWYRLQWKPQSAPGRVVNAKGERHTWLVFADGEGFGDALAKQLEAEGDTCHVLPVGEGIQDDANALSKNIEILLRKINSPLHGIVHLWSLSIPPQAQDASETMDRLGCNSVLYLVQALANRFAGSPHLFLVTKGAQAVQSGEAVAVEQSALWGLGKVISFELPELKCVRVDLDPLQSPADSVSLLARQVSTPDGEDQIAFRASNRFVLRLIPFPQSSLSNPIEVSLRRDHTYLVTGGLGGLGLATAKLMVHRGARHLVLLGRSEPPVLALQVVKELKDAGAEVLIAQADVSNPTQLKAVFEKIKKEMPALRGVIHAAGSLDDGALLNLDAHRMKNVMAPKVEGTWHLHQMTSDLSLDFFVLFSSAVSVLGSPGQGNYAAASAYLDAFAHYRRSFALPAISINWGPWAEIGLAAEATEKLQEQNASTQHLVKVIKIDQGLEILELLLNESVPQITVLPFDLKDLLELYPTAANMPFFAEVGGSETHLARLYARPNLRQDYVAPRSEIERKLAELWQQTLHIDRVGINDSFFELGGDSVLAAQILALARKTYGISINPQDAFQGFTIQRLAEILEIEILKQIEAMSEEEAQRRLSE